MTISWRALIYFQRSLANTQDSFHSCIAHGASSLVNCCFANLPHRDDSAIVQHRFSTRSPIVRFQHVDEACADVSRPAATNTAQHNATNDLSQHW
jgi:hypothetical protein